MSRQRTLKNRANINYLQSVGYQRVFWTKFDYEILTHIQSRRQTGRGSNKAYNNCIIMADTETSKKAPGADGEPNHICIWTISIRAYHLNICTLWGIRPSDMIKCITKLHGVMEGEISLIYFHNMSYDYTFLRQFMFDAWGVPKACLNTKPHYPISIKFDNGIQFRDSLCLAQRSLQRWGDDLMVEHRKAVGLWDYDIIRNQADYKYSEDELTYAENDTLVGVECLDAFMEALGKNITSIPYTATGVVRKIVQEIGADHHAHESYLRMCIDTWELLQKAMRCYHGGFTHANRYIIGMVIEGLTKAYDFASSYPYVMLTEKYPMEKYTRLEDDYELKDIKELIDDDYSILMTLKMSDVKLKNFRHPMPTLQLSKCIEVYNPVIDNGRIISCDYVEIDVTEINLQILLNQYDYKYIEFDDVYIAKKDYLPRWFTDLIFQLYTDKCMLKGGDPVLYDISKSKVNCCYGMCCQKPAPDDIMEDYTTGEYYIPMPGDENYKDPQERLDKHNKKYTSVLPYQWGIYVCEYAFFNLVKFGTSCCRRWLYSDTDSCFGQGWDEKKIEKYNAKCKQKMRNRGYGPVIVGNKEYNLGCAMLDKTASEFKTLGSKRYAYRDAKSGELRLTVAGVPKARGALCLEDDINNFRKDTIFKGSITGKKTHTFIYSQGIYTDENGNELADSIDLSECDYTLDETMLYNWFFGGEIGEFAPECYDGGLFV